MALHLRLEEGAVGRTVSAIDAVGIDHLTIHATGEQAGFVIDEGHAAAHAGTEVDAGVAQHDDAAAGHVLAAVVAHALDHRRGAAVAHREALAGHARSKQLAGSRAVEAGVADDDVAAGLVLGRLGREDDEPATSHALTGVVVGIALDAQR